jgi:hypothetical protein
LLKGAVETIAYSTHFEFNCPAAAVTDKTTKGIENEEKNPTIQLANTSTN